MPDRTSQTRSTIRHAAWAAAATAVIGAGVAIVADADARPAATPAAVSRYHDLEAVKARNMRALGLELARRGSDVRLVQKRDLLVSRVG